MTNTKSELLAKLEEITQALVSSAHPDVAAMLEVQMPRIEKRVAGVMCIGESSLGLALAFLASAKSLIENNIVVE